jgi:hypothetical protein
VAYFSLSQFLIIWPRTSPRRFPGTLAA